MLNQFKTVVLLGVLSSLLLGIGALVAPGALYLFGALAVAMNIGAYFFSDRLVLRMSGAREVTEKDEPRLHAMVAELAARAEIPKPRVFVMADMQPNAFATGRNPQHGVVAVTTGIMQILDARELRGVLAHELAHIKNRDVLIGSVAATMASVVSSVANALTFGAMFGSRDENEEGGSSPIALIAVAVVAPLAASLVQMGISRSREFIADAEGARIANDPEALASALLKLDRMSQRIPMNQPTPATASLFIVNPFGAMATVSRMFSTHPSTAERVERLMAMAGRTANSPSSMRAQRIA